jgi:hypothetical protein
MELRFRIFSSFVRHVDELGDEAFDPFRDLQRSDALFICFPLRAKTLNKVIYEFPFVSQGLTKPELCRKYWCSIHDCFRAQ